MFKHQDQFEELLGVKLKINPRGEAMTRCPLHEDKTPSLAINLETGVWFCHAGCGSGNVYTLAQKLGRVLTPEGRGKKMNKAKLLNDVVERFHAALSEETREYWHMRGINDEVLNRANIGYESSTGFYIFPYRDEEGRCKAYKKIDKDKNELWYPSGIECVRLFNLQDLVKAKETGSTLYIAEGEKDCLVLMMLGYLCVGVSGVNGFAEEYVPLFDDIKDMVVCFDNDERGRRGGERTAKLLGKKARLLPWPNGYPKDINDLYLKNRDNFKSDFDGLIAQAKPLVKPILKVACSDFEEILSYCRRFSESRLIGIPTGYPKIDAFTGGLRGICIVGGQPKIGKSIFATTIATNAADRGNPVIYCDFENGLHKTRLRILSRLFRITVTNLLLRPDAMMNYEQFECIKGRFLALSQNLFIHRPSLRDFLEGDETASGATDALFRKYVQCVREDFGNENEILIIIDSLQKLPLWNMSDRRANIDTWLRSFERARDEFNVTFLIISELSRGTYDSASIDSFKESGDIEYTADLAMQIRKDKDERGEEVLELHAVANRDGETGVIGTYRPMYSICDFEELPDNIFREEIRNGRRG